VLKETVQSALNDQIQAEFHSSYLYLAMAAWCETKNFEGFGHWMRMQAQEELQHAMKFYDYLNATGNSVILQAVQQPPTEWDSPLEMFRAALAHEQFMTENINKLVKMSMEQDDYATHNLLQWFVSEQVEEEATVDAICGKLEMMGDNMHGVYMMDRELSGRAVPSAPPA